MKHGVYQRALESWQLSQLSLPHDYSEFQKPFHVGFVDLKSAFDSVDRAAVWLALQGKGFTPKY